MTPREQVEAIRLLREWLDAAGDVPIDQLPEAADILSAASGGSHSELLARLNRIAKLRGKTVAFLRQAPAA